MKPTTVVFRRWKAHPRTVIALFPDMPGDCSAFSCVSYEHAGQHGAADTGIVRGLTVPATGPDKDALVAELVRIGYVLREVRRIPATSFANRRKALDNC